MTTGKVAEYLGLAVGASACGWLRRHGIRAVSRQPGPCGQNLYPAELVMSGERDGMTTDATSRARLSRRAACAADWGVYRSHGVRAPGWVSTP